MQLIWKFRQINRNGAYIAYIHILTVTSLLIINYITICVPKIAIYLVNILKWLHWNWSLTLSHLYHLHCTHTHIAFRFCCCSFPFLNQLRKTFRVFTAICFHFQKFTVCVMSTCCYVWFRWWDGPIWIWIRINLVVACNGDLEILVGWRKW